MNDSFSGQHYGDDLRASTMCVGSGLYSFPIWSVTALLRAHKHGRGSLLAVVV